MGFKTRKIPRDLILNPPPRRVRWWLWGPLILIAVSTALVAITAHAASPPEASGGELFFREGDDYVPATQLASHISSNISGIVAVSSINQRFTNQTMSWQEAVYVFPLPDDAAVRAMTMRIGDRVIRSTIHEKTQAKAIYERARQDGKSAALAEQSRPNLFVQSVANIPPGETIDVEIEFVHQVQYESGEFRLRLPLTRTPRYEPARAGRSSLPAASGPMVPVDHASNTASIHIDIDAGMAISQLDSPSHRVSVTKSGEHYWVDVAPTHRMDRDFVLTWRAMRGSSPGTAIFTQRIDGSDYALILLTPPQSDPDRPRLPRDVEFIIDVSGSMQGPSIEQAKLSLATAVSRLQPEDRFNVYAFSSDYRRLFELPAFADASNIERAQQWIDGLEADGGTEMAPPLAAALASPTQDGMLKQILFITDGAVGNETDLFRMIEQGLKQSRLFMVGIGAAPNSYFMRKAAQFGRGAFVQISNTREVAAQMGRLLAKIESPVYRDLEVRWHGSAGVDFFPRQLPELYDSEPLVMLARAESLVGDIEISGGGPRHFDTTIGLDRGGTADGVGTLWARAKIEALLDEKALGGDPDAIQAEVTRVALTHKLVSPWTSFVAVETWAARPPGESLATNAVPGTLPPGQQVAVMMPGTATPASLELIAGTAALALGLLLLVMERRRCASSSQS